LEAEVGGWRGIEEVSTFHPGLWHLPQQHKKQKKKKEKKVLL
jgi:hypothetical protein